MWKKTLLALATVAALAGFGAVVDSAPAAAQGMHRPMPRMHAPAPRFAGAPHARPAHYWGGGPRWHHPRRWHHRRHGWYGGGVMFYPPGVYGYDAYSTCRVVHRRVRVLTDEGWRLRWRKVRYCS